MTGCQFASGGASLSACAPRSPVRVCLVAHFAYGALRGGGAGHIGGVERQTTLMARWLATRGHEVTIVTWDEGQSDGVKIDGVTVRKVCRRHEGLPGVRFFHPRWSALIRALARSDADVYYQNCAEAVTGQAALWCRANGRRFVYSVASDPDCDPRLPLLRARERVLYRLGLRRAHRVVVQTRAQQQMLHEGFGVSSVVIPMPCPGPPAEETQFHEPPSPGNMRAVWLARLVRPKRPDRLIEVARSCPDIQFDLVGPHEDQALSKEIAAKAASVPNVHVHGPASRAEVDELYRKTHCLISTSEYEGFPNTYLEAWSHGVPVVALVDPDRVIAHHGLGVTAADVSGLASGLRSLLGSPDAWHSASRAARVFYLANHTVDRVMERFERVFLEEAAERRRVSMQTNGHGGVTA